MNNPNTENNQGYNPDMNQQPQYQAPQQPQYQQPQYQAPQQPQYQQPQYQQPQYQYQQPQYQYQQPQYPQKPNDGKGLSIAALVLGIVGVVFCWVGGLNILVLALCILGIVFGTIGRKKSIAVHGKASGMATAGLVLGIIGTAFAALGVIACVACTGCFSNYYGCGSCAGSCIEGAVDSVYSDYYW